MPRSSDVIPKTQLELPTPSSHAGAVAVDDALGLKVLASDTFAPPLFAVSFLASALDVLTERVRGAWRSRRRPWAVRGTPIASFVLAGRVLGSGDHRAFIYFQF